MSNAHDNQCLIDDVRTQIIEIFSRQLSGNNNALINETLIEKNAIEVSEKIRKLWAGQQCYIDKGYVARDKMIRDEFNGKNYIQLARKFNISESRIRTIVKKQRDIMK